MTSALNGAAPKDQRDQGDKAATVASRLGWLKSGEHEHRRPKKALQVSFHCRGRLRTLVCA